MKNLYVRDVLNRFALGSVLAFGLLGLTLQTGCGGNSHQPPPADAATLEQEAQEQLEIRELETSGGK